MKGRENSLCDLKGKLESREDPRPTHTASEGCCREGPGSRASGLCVCVSSPNISVATLEFRFC